MPAPDGHSWDEIARAIGASPLEQPVCGCNPTPRDADARWHHDYDTGATVN